MVSLTFHGGVNEIGGNKILLKSKENRIWLDFGQSFTMGEEYYLNWLQPRRSNGLGDYFEFNLLPKMKGLYSEDVLQRTDLKHCESEYDGVFLTHAHADHVNHISFIDPCVPIYLGEGTRLFMDALEKTSGFANYGTHDYRCFRTGNKVKLDDIEVEPIHVDHSIPAAYGYIIHTDEGNIVYSGDMRAHGPRADMTQEFLEAAQYVDPIAMICEGTRMARKGKRRNLSEAQVGRGVKDVCRLADKDGKSVIYTHAGRDMDRLRTFHNAAEACSRVMVVTPKIAYLLDHLVEDEHLDLPDPLSDDLISVYYKRKRSGTYSEKDYFTWERKFLSKLVTPEDLKTKPKDYIVHLDFFSFAELIDIRPEPGSHFIYSMSEPFSEEDLEEEVLHNWLNHFGLQYHQLHASGHMSRKELIDALQTVNPGKIFPVHTEAPELFKDHLSNIISPVKGVNYTV